MNKLSAIAVAVMTLPLLGSAHLMAADSTGAAANILNDREPQTRGFQAAEPEGFSRYVVPSTTFVPETSKGLPSDAGVKAHTNYVLHTQTQGKPAPHAAPTPKFTFAETPASMGCLYGVGPAYAGCNPATGGTRHPTGGWGAIAIVDAYDNPYAAYSLSYFSSYWKLPAATFVKVYANGNGSCKTPAYDSGWALEEALDIEWAHAMAPSAIIYLVEACSNSLNDLFYAETVAGNLVQAAGGGVVSNSWGSGEFPGETSYDNYFRQYWQRVTYTVSAGDSGLGAEYPSSSPWVVSAGGTTVNRDGSGNFTSESCWAGSGGGVSAYETWTDSFTGGNMGPWAAFQYPQFGKSARATPDLSFNADPASGVWVYDYVNGGWFIVGGTSVAAPSLAGIINNAGNRLGLAPTNGGYYSNMENNLLYAQLSAQKAYGTNFYDVTTGSNGSSAGPGWDYCTGVGTPRGLAGK